MAILESGFAVVPLPVEVADRLRGQRWFRALDVKTKAPVLIEEGAYNPGLGRRAPKAFLIDRLVGIT